MNGLSTSDWEIFAAVAATALLGGGILWLATRRKPTEEELELERRTLLVQMGRLVDGMLLDLCEVKAADGRLLTLLVFNYRIGGVDYECSQDITTLRAIVNPAEVRVGFPCTLRYQPGNPQNSIVLAEGWSGLRKGLPQLKAFEDPEPVDTSHLRAKGRGPRVEGTSK